MGIWRSPIQGVLDTVLIVQINYWKLIASALIAGHLHNLPNRKIIMEGAMNLLKCTSTVDIHMMLFNREHPQYFWPIMSKLIPHLGQSMLVYTSRPIEYDNTGVSKRF